MTTAYLPARETARRDPDPDAETMDLGAYLRVLWNYRLLLLVCAILGAVIAGALGLSGPRTYQAEAALSISRPKIGEGLPSQELMSTANFRPLIESRTVAAQVIKDTGLDKPPYDVSPSRFFGVIVDVDEVRLSSVVMLRGRLDNPALVARVVNRVAELGVETARRVSQQEALQIRNDIKLQLDEAKTRLAEVTGNLEQTRISSQLELVKKDVEAALEQRAWLLELLISTEAERAKLAQAKQELAKRKPIDTVRRSIDADPPLMEAARALETRPRDLLGLQVNNQEINKVYQDLDKEVAMSETRLASMEKQRSEFQRRRLSNPKLDLLNEMYRKESEVLRLEMERDIAKKIYQDVSTSYETARLQVAGRSSALQIISTAIPPDAPESRKVVRNLVIGMLSGLFLAVFAVLLMHAFSGESAVPRGARV